jgi:hypothetical protein
MKNILCLILIGLFISGCEKTVELKYNGNSSRMVIEGNITNLPGPYFVKISKSISLTDTGNFPLIDDAVVVVSDDAGNSETLIPQGEGMYRTTSLTGVPGRTYTLSVQAGNKLFTAQSTMPTPVPFDSIKVEQFIFGGEVEFNIIPIYIDPIEKGNNYRFLLAINDKLVNQHFVQNDNITNGLSNTSRLEIDDSATKLKKGDNIMLTMQCIDSKVSSYYNTLALMNDSGPGGGTTPNNPPSNFTNGALGSFSACTVETRSKVLQ